MPLDPRIGATVESSDDPIRRLAQRVADLERLTERLHAGRGIGRAAQHIGDFTFAASNTQMAFSAIPQQYRHLLILGTAKSAAAVTLRALGLQMNGGTTAYHSQWTEQSQANVPVPNHNTGSYARVGFATGGSAPNDNYWASTEIVIPRYSASIGVKQFIWRSQAFYAAATHVYGHGISTEDFTGSALTSLVLHLDPTTEAFNTNVTAFHLYGVP